MYAKVRRVYTSQVDFQELYLATGFLCVCPKQKEVLRMDTIPSLLPLSLHIDNLYELNTIHIKEKNNLIFTSSKQLNFFHSIL